MRAIISVSLNEELARELARFARKTGRNKSDIVKDSIRLFLWESHFREMRRRLVSRSKKAGMVTDDELFEAVS